MEEEKEEGAEKNRKRIRREEPTQNGYYYCRNSDHKKEGNIRFKVVPQTRVTFLMTSLYDINHI